MRGERLNYTGVSVALCQPAVRMLVLCSWPDEGGGFEHEVLPVVAILARHLPSLEEDSYGEEVEAVVADPEGGLEPVRNLKQCHPSTAFREVAAPWPALEDDVRLAALWPQLDRLATLQDEYWERRMAKERQARESHP